MFTKTTLSVLVWFEGLYSVRAVYHLGEDFYVQKAKGYARLKPRGLTSYKSMHWDEISTEELQLKESGIKLLLGPK